MAKGVLNPFEPFPCIALAYISSCKLCGYKMKMKRASAQDSFLVGMAVYKALNKLLQKANKGTCYRSLTAINFFPKRNKNSLQLAHLSGL